MTIISPTVEAFVLQNQQGLFLSKQLMWIDGRDSQSLYKTLHKDEAINQMVEVCSKDYTQRVKCISCKLNEKGLPSIDAALLREPNTAAALEPAAQTEPDPITTELDPTVPEHPTATTDAAVSQFLQQSLHQTDPSH